MTTPTPSAPEIERLADYITLVAKVTDNFAGLLERSMAARRQLRQNGEAIASALRALADARSDADNDRSRYKAQIEGLERQRDEAERHAENQRSEISRLRHWEEASKQQIEAQSIALADTRRERDEARRMLAEADLGFWMLLHSKGDPNYAAQIMERCTKRHASRLAAAKEKPDG